MHVSEPTALAGLGLLLMAIGLVAGNRPWKRSREAGAVSVDSTRGLRRPPASDAAACRIGSDVGLGIPQAPARRGSEVSGAAAG